MTNKHAQALGKLGGKQSVKTRFAGLSKDEISEKMRKVRLTPKEKDDLIKDVAGIIKDSILES